MIAPGSLVRIERDEARYPSRGTWPQLRGKAGTVVEHNLGEVGVSFGSVKPRTDGRGRFRWNSEDVYWFQPYEVTATGRSVCGESPQRPEDSRTTPTPSLHTRELVNA